MSSTDLFSNNDNMGYSKAVNSYAKSFSPDGSLADKAKQKLVDAYNDKINTIFTTAGDAFIQKGVTDTVTATGRAVKSGINSIADSLSTPIRNIKQTAGQFSNDFSQAPIQNPRDSIPQTGAREPLDSNTIKSQDVFDFIRDETGLGGPGQERSQPSASDDIFERGFASQDTSGARAGDAPVIGRPLPAEAAPVAEDPFPRITAADAIEPARGEGDEFFDAPEAPNEAGNLAKAGSDLAEKEGAKVSSKAALGEAAGEVEVAGGGPEDPVTDVIALGLGIGSLFASKKLQKQDPTPTPAPTPAGISITSTKGI